MHVSPFHYLPLVPLIFLLLVVVGGLVIAALQIGVISYAYEKMGVSEGWVTALLLGSLLGSYVNIPIAELGGGQIVTHEEFSLMGVRHVLPIVHDWPGTVLAINVGGAIIPTTLSIYLMVKNQIFGRAAVGVLVVAVVVHFLATPIEGKGIAVPIFVPPILSALVAMILSRPAAAPLAYISGSLGTLIGADLMNLHRLADLGRADRLDRRSGDVRRHLSDRSVGRPVGPLKDGRRRRKSVASADRCVQSPPKATRPATRVCRTRTAVGKPAASSGRSNRTRSARSPRARVTTSIPRALAG